MADQSTQLSQGSSIAEAVLRTSVSADGRRSSWRWPVLVAFAVLILVAFAVAMVIRNSVPGNGLYWMPDFEVYYAGGAAVLHGSPLYGVNLRLYDMQLPFTYTPFAALVFAPFALLNLQAAEIVWTVLNVLALGAVSWFALGMMRDFPWRLRLAMAAAIAVSATLLDPILDNLIFGQVNVLLMLLVLIDFQRWMPPRWCGIATGVAAGIKLIPLIFVVYLFCIGRRRAAVLAGVVFVGTLLLGLLIEPSAFHQYWLNGTAFDLKRILTPTDVDHSLFGFFARLSGDPTSPPRWALIVGILVGVFGLVAATIANRRGHDLLGVVIVGNTSLLVSPVTWMATMVWIVPTLIWLASATWQQRRTLLPSVLFVIVTLWFTVPVYWFAQRVGDKIPYQTTLTGNLLATLGSPMTPLLLGLATVPLWLPKLYPPKTTLPEHQHPQSASSSASTVVSS